MRLFLNPDVIFKSKKTFSYIYHTRTGWYYPCKPDFWSSLQSYRPGRDVDPQNLPPALSELIENRFLIQKKIQGQKDYLDFYPLRMPETVWYQNGTIVDVAVERIGAHGETDFDILTLEETSAELWKTCDGTKTAQEIITKLKTGEEEAFSAIKSWMSIENQILRLLSKPISTFKEAPPQLIYKAPFLPKKAAATASTDDVRKYHLDTISDGTAQFDRTESTLSHLYRFVHPILNGKTYGQALYTSIGEEKKITPGMRILEVGGGMGSISTDILSELKKEDWEVEYVIYDLSPALIQAQRELHKMEGVNAQHIHGNGEVLALKDSSIDIALSNEVIADFHTPEVPTKDVKDFLFDHEIPMTKDFFHWYNGAPEKVRVNLGAFMLLKELYRVLKPGGFAVITEYGYQERLPFRARHLDHPEYTIQFGQMISVATALGFGLRLTDAFDFLGFRSDIKLMTHFSFQAAFRIMEHNDTYLPNITYSRGLFKKQVGERAENFKGLRFVEPIKDPFKIVKVMLCHKPEIQAPPQSTSNV
jgi:ubiquinone/menaquinone biosynthesis C-methylase UbiE